MEPLQFLLVLVVVAAVVLVVSAPLRRGRAAPPARGEDELAVLEAEKEAKYREIRDAELDHRTGKLSEADWRSLDDELRAQALDILRRIDAAGG